MNFLSFDDGTDRILGILIAQGVHTDILLEISMNERKVFSVFHFEALFRKQSEERIKVMGLLLQSFVNGNS